MRGEGRKQTVILLPPASGSLSGKDALVNLPCPLQRKKNTCLADWERLIYGETLEEDIGKIVWGSEWPTSTIQNGQAWREGGTKQDILGLGSNWQLISHQLPRHGVADSPTPLTALEDSVICPNQSCPVNYCYNHAHCDISGAPDCQPTCNCPPAFTDNRCFLAGNNFTPTIFKGMANCS